MKNTILFLAIAIALIWFLWTTDKPVVAPTDTVSVSTSVPIPLSAAVPVIDPRVALLTQFFQHYNCPQLSFDEINEYLHAADQNHLDYRILPSISLQESTCGKFYPQASNNILGWDSGRKEFTSISECIDFVAERLANGYYYKDKTLEDKIKAYNPSASYTPSILRLIKEISNDPVN